MSKKKKKNVQRKVKEKKVVNKYEESKKVEDSEKEKTLDIDENFIDEVSKVYDEGKNVEEIVESKVYIDYYMRLFLYCLAFLIFFGITVYFLPNTFNLSASTRINYNETSHLDYKVYLKENDFYDSEYLGKDKIYIASLIDNILIDFNYNFNIEKVSNIDFYYDVVGVLSINDEASGNNYFEKEYVLSSDNKLSMTNDTKYSLSEQVEIDYNYYNTLANSFKQLYGVDVSSNLAVYLRIHKENNIEEATEAVDESTMFLKIPLSEKAVDIEMNYQDINHSSYLVEQNDSLVDNIIYGILSLISIAVAITVAIKLIRFITLLNGRKTEYDKFVGRILNEYDRLIVENSTGPDLKNNNVIKISRFEELLDVRDNLKLPIMYYVVSKHNKCYFYIKHDHDLYLMRIKAIDLEKRK